MGIRKNKLEKGHTGEHVGIVLNSEKKGKRSFSNKDSFWKTLKDISTGRR